MIAITPFVIWLVAGIVLFILEMTLPGFVLFFFGLGAWITAIVCWVADDISLSSQLLLFLVTSLLSLFLLRKFVLSSLMGRETHTEEDSYVAKAGEHVLVTKAIVPPAEGQVKYSGTFWRARADEPIEQDEIVSIVSQDGLIMMVRKST